MWKYIALLIVYRTLAWLPTPAAYAIARVAGDLSYLAQGSARRHVKDNMRHVLGADADEREVSRQAREVFRNVTRYYADLIRLPRTDPERLLRHDLNVHDLENLQNAVASGKGVVLVSGHYGNPELTVQALAAAGIYVYVLTEPLQPRQLSDLTHRLRSTHGHTYRPVSMASVKGALRHLRQGGVVAILCDRDIQKTGQLLPLCGCPARLPTGAATLAMRTGAQVVPAFTRRRGPGRNEVWLEPPLPLERTGDEEQDIRAMSEKILARLEEYLRQDPGQWTVLESIWGDDCAGDPRTSRS